MRSIAFILSVFVSFAICLQIPFLKGIELVSLVFSCVIGVLVTLLSRHKILDFSEVTSKWAGYAFIFGLIYGCFKFYTKYFILDHAIENSEFTDMKSFIETLILVILLMPLLEEFLFRGILFDDVKRALGNKVAILLTSSLFISLHLHNFTINSTYESVALMLPGVFIYVYLKLKTNNFLVSFIAHATHNLTAVLLLLILIQ